MLATGLSHQLLEHGINKPIEVVEKVISLVKERVTFAKELWDQSIFLLYCTNIL